jgi:hypothetical protein
LGVLFLSLDPGEDLSTAHAHKTGLDSGGFLEFRRDKRRVFLEQSGIDREGLGSFGLALREDTHGTTESYHQQGDDELLHASTFLHTSYLRMLLISLQTD